jgi:hypothetical protein
MYKIYKLVCNHEQLLIYKEIDEDFWYYYEAFANTAIAMIPGIGLLPYYLYQLNTPLWVVILIIILYTLIIIILIREALDTLSIVTAIEKSLIANFSKDKKICGE